MVPVTLTAASAADGPTLSVTSTGDAPVSGACSDGIAGLTLREALCQAATTGGTVVVPSGAAITLAAGPLQVDPVSTGVAVELRSAGPDRFTVDGNGRRILDLDPSLTGGFDMTVREAVLRDGAPSAVDATGAAGGGAILAGTAGLSTDPDALTVVDSVVQDNRNVAAGANGSADAAGGAIAMYGGTLTVQGSTFTGNVADGAPGGAIAMVGTAASDALVIDDSVFTGNAVTAGGEDGVVAGGAVHADGVALTVTRSAFRQNTVTSTSASTALGSAVHVTGATATITGTDVSGNTLTSSAVRATVGGGGALALAGGSVTASRLVGNTDTVGGSGATVSVLAASGRSVTATGDWWGSTSGAGAGVSGTVTTTPYVTLTAPTAPDYPLLGVPTVATAALRQSDGTAPAAALLDLLTGATGTFSIQQASGTAAGPAAVSASGTLTRSYVPGTEKQATVTVGFDGASVTGPIRRAYAEVTGPAAASVAEGATATFTATVDAYPSATAMQWQTAPAGSSTWSDVPGATATTLDVTAARADQGRRYRLVVTSAVGTTTSDPAALEVLWGAEVTAQPQTTTVVAGDDATFAVAVAGHLTPTLHWQTAPAGSSTWTDVPGATGTTYVRAAVSAGDDGLQVRAVAQGSAGSATSEVAVLHVQTPVVVTSSPAATTAVAGDTASLTAVVTGAPAPGTVVWERLDPGASDWTTLAGGTVSTTGTTTTATLDVTAAKGLDGAQYRARATQTLVTGAREVVTDPAALTVQWAPVVTGQPSAATVLAGQDATFTVGVDARPVAGVTWESRAPGASTWTAAGTGTTLTLTGVTQAADGTQVRARLGNGVGPDVLTDEVMLTVRTGAVITAQPVATTVDEGTAATFSVTAGGSPAPTVRWQERASSTAAWTDVAGATGSTLTFTATGARDGHEFRAIAANAVLADAVSDAASLTVLTAPTLTDPADTGAAPGATARFTVVASGSPTPAVSWQTSTDGVAWTPVPGATGGTYDRTVTAADDGLLVRAVATATLLAGPRTVTSAAATLTVVDLPVEVSSPAGVTASGTFPTSAGTPFTLDWVVLASDGTATWQASRDGGTTWGPLPAGATTQEITGVAAVRSLSLRGAAPAVRTAYRLTYTPTASDTGLQLRLVATNAAGTVVLGPVSVQVAPAVLTPGGTGGTGGSGGTGTGGTAGSGGTGTAAASAGPSGTAGSSATAASGGSLARTGTDVTSLLALVGLLTVSGLGALALRRRRA